MKQCKSYEGAMSYDCAGCSEECSFRKSGNLIATVLIMIFIIVALAVFIYVIIESGWNRSDIIGTILIIVIGAMAYFFAQLLAGRKKGDKQIIDDFTKECAELNKNYFTLKVKYDKMITDKAERIMSHMKLGSKTKFINLNKEEGKIK